jgi:hypothetical protein
MASLMQNLRKGGLFKVMQSATYGSLTLNAEIGAVDERVLNKQCALASLPEVELQQEALSGLRYELDLPSDERRRRVISRLRAWLQLDAQAARRLAVAYEGALEFLDAEERHSARETEEDAIMDGLSYREFERLATFMPSLQQWEPSWRIDNYGGRGLPGSFAAALALAGMNGEL